MADGFVPGETVRVKDVVQGWLLSDGWKLSDGTAADFCWVLQLEDASGRRLSVSQPKNPGDQIRIAASVAMQGEQKVKFEVLPVDVRQTALWRLRFFLLAMNVTFGGVIEPLQKIEVGDRIYFDGLTKDALLRRVMAVRSALLAVMWSFAREIELSTPPVSDSDGRADGPPM